MKVFAGTDIGKARETNQDYYYISKNSDDIKLCVLADGMGGYAGGEVASNLAVSSAKNYIYNNYNNTDFTVEAIINLLKDATQYANMIVYEKTRQVPELGEMGTTLEIALIVEDKMYISHVGDSRIYKIRNGKINKITNDHSYVENLIQDGTITEEEAKYHPKKNVLTKALGCTAFIEPDLLVEKFMENDIILICSDGLTNMLSEEEIVKIIEENPESPNKALILAANKEGGMDNITVIVIKDED
ncbi:MAG: Stp1/IreP family PP2C-type Ser/Thr phosphatase [Clostridia bacterium]|nr:Stp1/IreP family PP2C-type Ser/Thr phosphatase [Clostridia bacterium]